MGDLGSPIVLCAGFAGSLSVAMGIHPTDSEYIYIKMESYLHSSFHPVDKRELKQKIY